MLDPDSARTAAEEEEAPYEDAEAPPADAPRKGRIARLLGAIRRLPNAVALKSFSSLTRRIVLLNLAGMCVLVSGILYLSEFRAGLIDARVQSLLVQGEIIAGAIAASAQVETNAITIDPERLLELQAGESYGPGEEGFAPLEFPINPERVAPVLKRLVEPTGTRARIYDRDGVLLLDSRSLYSRGEILRFDMPPPTTRKPNWFERAWNKLKTWFERGDLPLYKDLGPNNGKGYTEVVEALQGQKSSAVQVNDRGQVIVSVAVPVQRFRAILGVLLLSTQGGEIDAAVAAERLAIVRVFLVAIAVMGVLSFLLAGTIAGPVRRLADAAERVRRRTRQRVEIPDFTRRSDEIGHLSGALRDMTDALYSRIEAIESFAADVSHELKNPLTSLRSAVETLPLAKTDNSRGRLMEVIQHDVRRLDRLITDISDASRLDAELQRQEAEPVDLTRLLNTVTGVHNDVVRGDEVRVKLAFEHAAGAGGEFIVPGHDSRLGQVINNLIDNARSFSPKGGEVRVTCRRLKDAVEIMVDDDGPGIPPHALTRIFERFYTDRPEEQGFGQNSGLGLSISRQIIEAHGGRIWAENRPAETKARRGGRKKARDAEADGPRSAGARFVIHLPAA
ncbi:stimulus-sensing domain-containing protein [Ancylobacter mangrovi]|uniref:stimulus-sensing domain-containing protein n=1 Tax=Ancylobacter mangrovi TaxID=2972472 RepID=UPI0035A938DD